jgi:hypothetical protein
MANFFAELKRRYRVAAAHAVVAWGFVATR